MARYSFAILVAQGNHSHAPPPPTRLPQAIANDVILALQQGDILAQTPRILYICVAYTELIFAGRFILSSEYQWLLKKFNSTSLQAIHSSLAIEDKITAFIRAERIKQFPKGTDVLGMQNISLAYAGLILSRCSTGVSVR